MYESTYIHNQVKYLDFQYRDYIQNNQSIPPGTKFGNYQVGKQIGRGAFGKIYEAYNSSRQKFAVKLIDLIKISQETNPKVKEIRQRLAKNEPQLMQQCNSPNILKQLKILVLEYCDGKTLQQIIKQKKVIEQKDAVNILRQIINGIAELHRHSIIHRDLKADNIMKSGFDYKIIDLGFSKKLELSYENAQIKHTILGTVTTMAPEVLAKEAYGLKADIWSIGVIFFQMVFGIMLYDTSTAKQRYKEIEQKNYFGTDKELSFNGITISKEANNFLFNVLQVKTEKRLGWRQLQSHPLIQIKQSQPLGNQFVPRRSIQIPQVDLEIQRQSDSIRYLEQEESERFKIQKTSILKQQETKQKQQSKKKLQKIEIKNNNQSKKQEIKKQRFKINLEYNKNPEEPSTNKLHQQQKKQKTVIKKKVINYVPPQKSEKQKQNQVQAKWVRQSHLECVKTQLLYHQIIIPIQNDKLINFNNRQVVEFMYLICTRSFNNISPLKYKLSAEKDKKNIQLNNLMTQVQPLYKRIDQKFKNYSDQLTKIQNSYYQIFLDFFKKRIFNRNAKQKSNFTQGIQHSDYKRQEQIDYTYNNYIPQIITELQKNQKTTPKLIAYLKNYKEIMKITLEELKGETYTQFIKKYTQ